MDQNSYLTRTKRKTKGRNCIYTCLLKTKCVMALKYMIISDMKYKVCQNSKELWHQTNVEIQAMADVHEIQKAKHKRSI